MDKEKKNIYASKTLQNLIKQVENRNEQEKINNYKKKQMFSNTTYLKWLENFTIEYPSFSDNDWLYFPEKLSKEDKEKVENLYLLYEGIELYAEKNYIYPTKCDFGNYYNIKLDNIGYEIGILSGQGTLFFCKRTLINKDIKYIDFNDIINDKKSNKTDMTTYQLKDLSNKVLKLYKKGIPLDAIIDTINDTLNNIETEEKNYTRKLKK